MKKNLIFSLILIGFSAMAGQIVLMRQLMVIFYGNELSLGITLAIWLFWTGLGSLIIGKWLSAKIKQKFTLFCFGEILLGLLLPLSLFAARLIPLCFNYSAGEIIGLLPMSLATFLLLAPTCILIGFLFVLGCEVYVSLENRNLEKASEIGYVYILEALGASIGGLIISFFLIRILTPIYIMALITFLNLLAAFLLLVNNKILKIFTGIIIITFLFLIFSGNLELLNQKTLNLEWRGYELLAYQDSIYGNIAVTKKEDVFTIFNNGLYDFSVPDELSSERMAHFPLLEHPLPKKVLLIGGGSSGQINEVLKHPVDLVDYVELDPLLIKMAKKYLSSTKAFNDKRVRVISNMDARLFIKRTDNIYDVIIISLPAPNTAQLNRFYTKEFYEEAKKILDEKGVLSFCLYSNPNYISSEQAQLYMTLKNTLWAVFPEVVITPGEVNYFLASNIKGLLTLDWQKLIQRLKERNIQAKYMREYYLYSELSNERIDAFGKNLLLESTSVINRDFKPIAYYYNLVLWSTYFKYNLKKVFQYIDAKKIYLIVAAVFILLLLPSCFSSLKKRLPHFGVLTCVSTTGFAEITFQIVTLISFQVIYGFVYYKLGIILTSYMIGLIFGSWLITKRLERNTAPKRGYYSLFLKTQVLIFTYPLILLFFIWLFSNFKKGFGLWIGSNIIFPFLPIIAGFIGGFQFPLANKLYLKSNDLDLAHSAGITYALDLFGSCIGAVISTVFLVPIIGIPLTCILVAVLNLVGLILLLTYSAKTSALKI
ncbi:MAG: fused MFS/spermidine synthase [Candidatus Omnitrophota bacterium]